MGNASSSSARRRGSAVSNASLAGCCSAESRALGEPVEGSAVVATPRWLMIQVQEAWAPKTPNTACLQGAVGDHITEELERIGGARLQLIRRPQTGTGVRIIAATVGGQAHMLTLEALSDIVDVDIGALFAGGAGSQPVDESLILVCTHGLRDRCCAVEGIPVYNALAEQVGDRAWQTTHLGGHRFAATLVVLPQGLQFGRVLAPEVPALVDGLDKGEIYRLDRFRGRVDASRVAQVAEAHVRKRQALRTLDAVAPSGDDLVVEGRPVKVQVSSTPHATPRAYSCGDTQLKTPMEYAVSLAD